MNHATTQDVHGHPALQHHFENMEQQREAGTLGMWVFLVTEIMFFGGMFLAYTLYRSLYPAAFASASNHLDITLGTVNTAVGKPVLIGNFGGYLVNMSDFLARAPDRGAQSPGNRRVVRLDADAIVQSKPVIDAAAKQHGVLLEHPQAWGRFARVGNLCIGPFNRAHKLARSGGHSGQMLKEIQSHSLTREQHIGKAAGASDHLSGFNFFAVGHKRLDLLLGIERDENFFGGFQSGDDHLFAGHKSATRPCVAHQDRLRSDVSASQVFTQKQPDA